MGRDHFLNLGSVFAHTEPSETKVSFPDGSSFAYACDTFKAERGVIAFAHQPALVVRIVCARSGRPSPGSVIWVQGGPFGSFDPNLPAELSALVSLGYEAFFPLYPGSGGEREYAVEGGADATKISRISPDMDDAVAELTAVIRSRQQAGPVVLVGNSFGALPAAIASPVLRDDDRLVLLDPMLKTPREGLLSPGGYTLPAVMRGGENIVQGMSKSENEALSGEILRALLGRWLDENVETVLARSAPSNILVVYGDKDARIGLERMPRLLAQHGGRYRSLVLEGSDHAGAISKSQLEKFIRAAAPFTGE